MADFNDVMGSTADADASQADLSRYTGSVDEGERPPNLPLMVGLAAIAVCDRLNALSIRLDYLAHQLQRKS